MAEHDTSGVPVSVAMATYNGSAHVAEQLASILEQLGPRDEVVVVDDASTDDTLAVLRSFEDPRLRVVESPVNRGYVRAFESALAEVRGEIVLLADQDDVWLPGRVELLARALVDHQVAASNLVVLGTGAPLRAGQALAAPVCGLRSSRGQRRRHPRRQPALLRLRDGRPA